MPKEGIIPEGDEEIYMQVDYIEKYSQVVIVANNRTLQYLQNILQVLIDSPVSGKHFHFTRGVNPIDGNIDDLEIRKK